MNYRLILQRLRGNFPFSFRLPTALGIFYMGGQTLTLLQQVFRPRRPQSFRKSRLIFPTSSLCPFSTRYRMQLQPKANIRISSIYVSSDGSGQKQMKLKSAQAAQTFKSVRTSVRLFHSWWRQARCERFVVKTFCHCVVNYSQTGTGFLFVCCCCLFVCLFCLMCSR